jgi:muramoyltetrapeptide carboxypeptidase
MASWPRPLPPGASLAVWAPSSPASALFPVRFARGLAALAADGYRVRQLASCGKAGPISAGPPSAIAAELHEALDDPRCDGVVATVGGWTMLRVLPYIDLALVGAAGKPLIGYSDLTSLLNVVTARTGLVTFHGPMVLSEWGEAGGPWDYTRAQFHAAVGARESSRGGGDLVIGTAGEWSDEQLWWDRDDTRRRLPSAGQPMRVVRGRDDGEAVRGPLWGGSLVALSLLLGTPWWPRPSGAIVFLEAESMAPDEFAVRLEQLRMAGVFDHARALILGKICRPAQTASGCADFDAVACETVPARIPVVAGFDIGHAEPMATLPIGATATLSCPAGGSPLLTIERP